MSLPISDKTQLILLENYFSGNLDDKSKFTNFWKRYKINANYFVSIQSENFLQHF